MSRRVPPPTAGRTVRPAPGRTVRPTATRGRQLGPRRNPRWLLIGGVAAVVVIALAVFMLLRGGSAALTGVQTFTGLSQDHVETAVTYPQSPPVGGPHNPRWQNCGIYDTPIESPYGVHAMEHGAVWITYQPELSAGEIEQLREQARGHGFVLLTPYPGLDTKVALSAWGVQLKVNDVGDAQIPLFIQKYERGSQTPEPGASCRSGVGTPIER